MTKKQPNKFSSKKQLHSMQCLNDLVSSTMASPTYMW